jgi:CheY-like chemotaxis protein
MRRVFIMDDNALVLRLYTDLLQSLGWEVQSCSDSLEQFATLVNRRGFTGEANRDSLPEEVSHDDSSFIRRSA